MTEKLLGIFDNGKDSTVRGTCNDCGASLRYEYMTDGGVYGSECVHAHIHRPDWMTLKAKHDAQKWIGIQNTLTMLEHDYESKDRLVYVECSDGSVMILNNYSYLVHAAEKIFIDRLIDAGWKKSYKGDYFIPRSSEYVLIRP